MGRRYKGETFTGDTYWEDEDGNRESEGETFTGQRYREDSDGNRRYEGETWTGRKYLEDSDGNRVYEDEVDHGETFTGTEYEEDKGGCFLTTACVEYAGLADDCRELATVRSFRDGYIKRLPNGEAILAEYYEVAPSILRGIKEGARPEVTFGDILETVRRVVRHIESGDASEAMTLYERMFSDLRRTYCEPKPMEAQGVTNASCARKRWRLPLHTYTIMK